jgi:hypothetical protein
LRGRRCDSVAASIETRRAIDADALAKIALSGGPHVGACLAAVGAVALLQNSAGGLTQLGALVRAAA